MKKFDYIITAILVVEMLTTLCLHNSINIAITLLLTTIVPMILLAIISARLVFQYHHKFSWFYSLAASALSTIIIFAYSLLFPWEKLIADQNAGVTFNPGIGNLISTLVMQFAITAFTYLIVKQSQKNND
ncbi:hypothetical protein [Convivina intestini]|uniref:hypothetical protein n=1 Tax=Convivina intestini TaxID=1505726 RepID=UPI00200E359F|nr:hypothetical protein [Convivina intestini]CAH1857080.1 hypothetical protein R078131_01532 [Convivina intestini]